MRFERVLILVLMSFAGCGDSGPGAPSSPTPIAPVSPPPVPSGFASGATVRVVTGENGSPVVGAAVRIGSSDLTTDSDGAITLPRSFAPGTLVDISAPGFVLRQTLLRAGADADFTLIPTEGPTGITGDFVSEVMYHDSTGTTRRMLRIRPGAKLVYVSPTEQIRRDPRAMEKIRGAVHDINGIVRGELVFVVGADPPPDAVVFELIIDPAVLGDDVLGHVERQFSGWNIIGGRVVYDSIETVRTTTTPHELGHMLGLGHSASIADVMYPYIRRNVDTFAPRERLAIRLIMQRPAANREPDNDRDVSSAQTFSSRWASIVNCYR